MYKRRKTLKRRKLFCYLIFAILLFRRLKYIYNHNYCNLYNIFSSHHFNGFYFFKRKLDVVLLFFYESYVIIIGANKWQIKTNYWVLL